MSRISGGQLPDGIVCYNDQIAVQVMEELEKMGVRIPDDISITGYDNSLYAQRGSGITTIAHPQEKLGEMAAELILEKINGVPEEESKVERLIYFSIDFSMGACGCYSCNYAQKN